MRVIDADALKESARGISVFRMYDAGTSDLRALVDAATTLNYAPVVHGAWGEYEAPYGFPSLNGFPCSVCGMHQTDIRGLYYCPNCGAKMDGGGRG